MDSLTHALIAALLGFSLHLPPAIPFLVLGSVVVDTDILWPRISDRDPSLYLFTHGGIVHSIFGTIALAVIAWGAAEGVLATGLVAAGSFLPPAIAFAAILAGALLHAALDALAVPGLPLLAPFSDRKFTAGLFPGPSIFLMAVSLFFLVWVWPGGIDLTAMAVPYVLGIAAYCVVRIGSYAGIRHATGGKGRAIPRISPFRWLVIDETPDAFLVSGYRLGRGREDAETFSKYRGTDAGEIAPYLVLPEVRRLRFHSYLVVAEKTGEGIVFSDPLRASGRIFYPPHFVSVRVNPCPGS